MGTKNISLISCLFLLVFGEGLGLEEFGHDYGYESEPSIDLTDYGIDLNPTSESNLIDTEVIETIYTTTENDGVTLMYPDGVNTSTSGEIDGDETDPSTIRDTLNLLKQGDEEILLSDDTKDVVLILGNTGAGKSTFTQWISKNNSGLVAKETAEDTGEFLIEDNNNRIGESTIKSKTTFPELVTDSYNNYTYCDFPGFSDTRSTSNDIATSYFIKKVVDHVDRIKIIFVVSYPSVRKGVDRQDFMKMVRHIIELVKDIKKYRHSIALVVTKVDNQHIKKKGILTLINDETVIRTINYFLQEVKLNLVQDTKLLNVTAKEHLFYENAIKFIDVLLVDDGFSKIALFRRPDESGPVDSNDFLLKEKEDIRSLVFDKLKFVSRNNKDFGYTISEKSKNDIIDISEEIHRNVLIIVSTIANEIKTNLGSLVNQADVNINSFNISDTESLDSVLSLAELLNGELSGKYNALIKLIDDIKTAKDVEKLSNSTNSMTKSLNIKTVNENVLRLMDQARYFNFIREVSDREFILGTNNLAWASAFQSVVTDLSDPKIRIQNSTNYIANEIDTKIKNDIFHKLNMLKYNISNTELIGTSFTLILNDLKLAEKKLTKLKEIKEPSVVFTLLEDLNIHLSNHTKVNLRNHKKYYDFLQREVKNMIDFVDNSIKWNHFIIFLFDKLAGFKIQNDRRKCANSSLNIIGTHVSYQVQDTNISNFMQKCFEEEYTQEYNAVKFVKLDPGKSQQLTKVIQQTLLQHPERTCEWYGKLTVKGPYVKLSDVFAKECPSPISIIEIFALDKVFIDRSVDKRGEKLQLSIVAPIWEVIGNNTITLDGDAGVNYLNSKADDGEYSGADGNDGQPGRPGAPGGNFFGVVETLINSRGLTISANGGNGGPGQDGGNGRKGSDGSIPDLPASVDDWMWIWNSSKFIKSVTNFFSNVLSKSESLFTEASVVEIKGDRCTDGGNGGAGGYGGMGGAGGEVTILYTISNDSEIRISQKQGQQGSHGSSGMPGEPGASGQNLIANVQRLSLILVANEIGEIISRRTISCDAGQLGSGFNSYNMESPEHLPNKEELFVRDYEMYLKENVNRTLTRSNLNDFYKYVVNKM